MPTIAPTPSVGDDITAANAVVGPGATHVAFGDPVEQSHDCQIMPLAHSVLHLAITDGVQPAPPAGDGRGATGVGATPGGGGACGCGAEYENGGLGPGFGTTGGEGGVGA